MSESTDHKTMTGVVAPLPIANLDTDQIMPKQFLRGIDKSGLVGGVLHDLRFDENENPREDFILNKPGWENTAILVGGPNFGCGSSREHAVWGLQQFGIKAVIASSFGEIFFGNSLNNRLLPIVVPEEEVEKLLRHLEDAGQPVEMSIDVEALVVHAPTGDLSFELPHRYHQMFLQGLDVIGASLQHRDEILAFAERHWQAEPWVKNVPGRVRARLDAEAAAAV